MSKCTKRGLKMGKRFYFNEDEDLYVDEGWLVMYLHKTEYIDEREILNELRSGKKYFGWREITI